MFLSKEPDLVCRLIRLGITIKQIAHCLVEMIFALFGSHDEWMGRLCFG